MKVACTLLYSIFKLGKILVVDTHSQCVFVCLIFLMFFVWLD